MTVNGELLNKLPLPDWAKQQLPEYVQFLRGPESLKAIVGISEVFLDMLALQGFEEFPNEAYKFESIAKEIVAHDAAFQSVAPHIRANRHVKASKALRNVITPCPAYALFYYRTVVVN